MSKDHRLQVLVPAELDAQLQKAAQRGGMSKGEWVRRALEKAVRESQPNTGDPLTQLAELDGPTGNIEQMLAEIEAGRR